ncbi:hypothetical protein [Shewanella sp. YLB-07]|uniref:hypothetical protein n=1 Tax=Shewanella sp. YLB-07 TaxID=2601268 RepID=UPI00128C519E|nr:hypothetical protein [Shewanella sp. YLB-07]MPY24516.1 hypothetical protein [Shewanella sp. YLB-07]
MHIAIKTTAVAISLSLLSACGGSSSDEGDKTVPSQSKVNPAYFENGIKIVKKDYLPLYLNIISVRDEGINFSIGLPKNNGYSGLTSSNLNKTNSNMTQQVWRSGHDQSIQIHMSKVNEKLKLKVNNRDGNKPWKLERDINVAKDAGYLIVTPQEADIEGVEPVAFVEGLDSNAQADFYFSIINRFSDPTLGSTDSNICLAAVSQISDAVYLISASLKQGKATELHNLSMLDQIWSLAVVTKAKLNVLDVSTLPTDEQLTGIQGICPDFTVGNGETLRLLNPKVTPSSMTANIIYSPSPGEVAFTDTSVGLASLAWESE